MDATAHRFRDAAGETGDDGVGDFGDVASEAQDAERHHEDGRDDRDFGRASDALLAHGGGDKKIVTLLVPPMRRGLRPSRTVTAR